MDLVKKIRITRIIEETLMAKTFVLEALEGWKPVYKPGQFLTLVFNTPFGEKRRSYSISSAPGEPLAITVKRVPNGEFSRQLNDKYRVGDILLTTGISGLYTLPGEEQNIEQYFFLAAGSGITPCITLIKTLLHKTGKKVCLIYSNRSEDDTIFYQEILRLQKDFSTRFYCKFIFSNSPNVLQKRLSSFVLEDILNEHLQVPPAQALFYLCGPYEYMQAVTITLLINKIPASNIKTESFDTTPRSIHPVPPDINAHKVTIHISGKVHEVTVQYPHSIVQAAKAHDIVLPYSCEAGRCGSCIASCTKGQTWMAYNEVLTDAEVARGRVLTCQAYPINGNAEIVYGD